MKATALYARSMLIKTATEPVAVTKISSIITSTTSALGMALNVRSDSLSALIVRKGTSAMNAS